MTKELKEFKVTKGSKTPYDVKEATVILANYGVSHNEKKTRELIAKGKLKADKPVVNGVKAHENDRRAGYIITSDSLYELIVQEIPIMKQFLEVVFPEDYVKKETKPRASRARKQTVTEEPKEEI